MGSGHTDYDHLVVTTQTCTSVVSGSNDMLPIELAELAVSGYGAWPGLHRGSEWQNLAQEFGDPVSLSAVYTAQPAANSRKAA